MLTEMMSRSVISSPQPVDNTGAALMRTSTQPSSLSSSSSAAAAAAGGATSGSVDVMMTQCNNSHNNSLPLTLGQTTLVTPRPVAAVLPQNSSDGAALS